MVLKGWLLLLLPPFFLVVHAQDAKGTCNSPLGLSSRTVEDGSITSPLGEVSTPAAGRLNKNDGAWCFSSDLIASQNAVLMVDLGNKRFVSGFGSQGPPESIHPKAYSHVVGFSTSFSLDRRTWEEFNGGNWFFDNDKNDTSDAVNYHLSNTVELAQYVKIGVTRQVSGSTTICLRFEIYGCDTDILPSTDVQALTTPKGKIEVKWKKPSAETSLEPDSVMMGVLTPNGYAVSYRPVGSDNIAKVATGERMVSLEDVRLGATYEIQLQCLYTETIVNCGSTQIEAYPPCPEEFTGGNEYHCFLYLDSVASFEEARTKCLNPKFDQQIGGPGYLVDEEERRFLVSRILPKGSPNMYLIGELCQDNDDCCKLLRLNGDTLEDVDCSDEKLTSALCLRDHKGEGARIRVSSVEASEDGSSATFVWRYEGTGWKTDELQVKMWTSDDEANPSTFTFSTLSNSFEVKAEVGVMYSLLLRPAPNIRTEEFVYKCIIIDFQESSDKYGAVLTPVPMSIYIIWSGSIRVTWDDAKALSKSGKVRLPNKYSITHQMTSPESTPTVEVEVASGREFVLTPIEMSATYVFKMSCFFEGVFHPCGEISIKTDPPDLVLAKSSNLYIVYEVILDKLKTWAEAEDDCQQRAGHLTSLLDDDEAKALLKMLPNENSKMWTGAKFAEKDTGYWTDGQKITYLPMAKTSGVTSSSESCCRAINEMGKLKLSGGVCEEQNPYICKYSVEEMISIPSELEITEPKWNFFKLSWSKPNERWMPTFYNVRACLQVSKTNCVVKANVKGQWQLDFENLLELRAYEVEVEAVLQPVEIKTTSGINAMTYPKSPLKVSISPKGKAYANIPMLIARGFPSATVTATLYQSNEELDTFTGGVKDLAISGLAPQETYKLIVKQDGGEWTDEFSFAAEPTCFGMDAFVDSICYTLAEESVTFNEAEEKCSESPDEKDEPSLWLPQSEDQIRKIATDVGPYINAWVQKPNVGSMIGTDAVCKKEGNSDCCFYDIVSASILCSACCDEKRPYICSYKIKEADLGEVTDLLPDFVGNTTIRVQWLPPEGVSWRIRKFELEWLEHEKSLSLGKETLVGAVKKLEETVGGLLEGLDYGTEYEIRITPLGATDARGKTQRILITTLDPRTPILVNVDSDGGAKVYSPLLMEKGMASKPVYVSIFKMDGPKEKKTFIYTQSGEVQRVDIQELELGQRYWVEMSSDWDTKLNYSTAFSAYPSCNENQIQDGLVCIWAPPDSKTWTEAYEVCKSDNGQLLDYKTQEELSQPVKALLTSYIESKFWLEMGAEGTAALRDATTSDCPTERESEVMCCTYEVSEEGELDDLKCSCCNEPRPFACKKTAKLNLGDIGDVFVNDVTTTSVTLSWTMASVPKWQKRSFIITWSEVSSRKRRAVEDSQLVTSGSPASVTDLKPGTEYTLKVASYAEATQSSGDPKVVPVTTVGDINIAGWTDSGCTIVILKISCCITVVLGSAFTVFVFIATRMFYLDCLAQIFAELATLGAYICILVSSAQSYNGDSQCLKANPNLCIAVSVLIQFFFQVVYLFTFLESLLICNVLKDYLPQCCTFRSLLAMSISGFGIPAAMMIVLAAVASDGFSDGNDNCWLDLQGNAMLPSVIPVVIFGSLSCLLLLSVFDADEPRKDISNVQQMRGRIYLKTRWGCFLILTLTTICYTTGMIGVNNRSETLHYVFIGFSTALGILIPIIRIRFDAEVREQLKRGLFASLKDDLGAIRVSPAPDSFDPNPLLNMSEFETRKYKQHQLEEIKAKESMNTETVWHQ